MLSDFSLFLVKLQNEALEAYMWLLFILGLSRRFQAYISHRSTLNLSAVKQKGESQNGCYKKTKNARFPKDKHFFPPDAQTCVCLWRGKKCSFSENLVCIAFLVQVFWHALLPCYRRIETLFSINWNVLQQ